MRRRGLLFYFDDVTSRHITSRHVTSHHITSHDVTSRHITSRHVTSRHITSRHVTSRHVTSRHVTSRHITSCNVASHLATSRHITTHHVTSRHIMSRHVTSRHVMSRHVMSRHVSMQHQLALFQTFARRRISLYFGVSGSTEEFRRLISKPHHHDRSKLILQLHYQLYIATSTCPPRYCNMLTGFVSRQSRKYTCDVTLRRVRVTNLILEEQ